MPHCMRKLRNQDLYKVFNKATGEIKSSGSTKEDAKKQLRLLKRLEKKKINRRSKWRRTIRRTN
jgi:hypothetical protein